MNESLKRLYDTGIKQTRTIIGLMSGTSLDGLDVALCEINGNGKSTKINVIKFTTFQYDEDFKTEVKTIFSKKTISLEKLCLLNEWIGERHANIVNSCLKEWNIPNHSIDLIASHGQTVYHAPIHLHLNNKFGNGTLQIGDGDHIAVNTGIITISDFRQKNIAAGGEGAPLAAYGDFLLFAEKEKDVIMLNIGGIANFTFMPADCAFENVICSDVGPGNCIMDAWMNHHFPEKFFDENAMVAKAGTVDEELLNSLKENDFFIRTFPKTTGPELFNLSYLQNAMIKSNTQGLSVEDGMATLNAFTAVIINDAIKKLTANKNCKLIISGGGLHNQLLISNIRKTNSQISIESTLEKNIEPDAKEAVLFALLANECIAGNNKDFGRGNHHLPSIAMGKISFPK